MADVRRRIVAAGTVSDEELAMQGSESSKELQPRRSDGMAARKGHLERGWVKHRLVRDFALGEKNQKELAEQYGVSQTSISQFKKRHALEIEEVRNNLADQYAGVWVARKLDRIREYQNAAEKMASGESARSQEVLVSILKAVAEELGDLPARQQINISQENVTYEIVGIDPDDI
jgi:transcriptional regulator with XRE-family HTH domain